MEDIFSNLNEAQSESVKTTEGPVRVLAGAGTGKTKALISRYCYLVKDLGISPKNILCVTFTNRAASEMKYRIRSVLGDMDLGFICTFHAFCSRFLSEEINALNFPKEFMILDKEDWREIMLRIFEDMNLTLRETTVQRKIDEVLEAKKIDPDTYIEYIYKMNNEELRGMWENNKLDQNTEIFLRFIYEQKKCFGVDFNDLINFTTYILEHFPDIREKWQNIMEYVMVDEFQDVSAKQYRIAEILSAKHKNLFIVGDSDQTIYSWRGSHVKLILDFDKKYPAAKTILLTQNYRSTPQIIKTSNCLISKNTVRYPKDLVAVQSDSKKPVFYHADNDRTEAEWICKKIKEISKTEKSKNIAILYRAHWQSRILEEILIKEDVPYKILSGTEFYGRKEVKDAICYLRMLVSADDTSFFRTVNTPSRKIGKTKQKFLRIYAQEHNCSAYVALKDNLETSMFKKTAAAEYVSCIESIKEYIPREDSTAPMLHTPLKLSDIFQTLMDRSGYEAFLRLEADQNRLDNLAEFKRSVNEASLDDDTTLESFLQHLALFTDLDRDDEKDNVKMLTIHAAKGMEFPYVFICGLNEGIFPSKKINTPEDMEEERRIAYVAFTRAKKMLYVSDAEGKTNEGLFKYPSRFIFDAGLDNFDVEKPIDASVLEQSRRIISVDNDRLKKMENLLKVGDEVEHPAFGKGKIVLVNANAFCYVIKFESLETERCIQFGAKLTKLG